LHSDDQLLPNFASILVPLLEKYPNTGIAVGERMLTNEKNVITKIPPFYNINCIIPGLKQAKVFMMTSFLINQVLFRRDVFDKIGDIDERFIVNLDGLLWFKCALQGDVAYIQKPVSIYRIHKEQITAKYNQTINHMLEYHNTLTEMFKLAKGILYLEQFFDDAVKRVGELTVRYCDDIIKNENYDLAKRYLALATVFDPKIVNREHYKILKESLETNDVEPLKAYNKLIKNKNLINRKTSYSPPEGSIKI